MDSLNGVQFLFRNGCNDGVNCNCLDMKNKTFTGARIHQETSKSDGLPKCQASNLLSQGAKGDRPHGQFDLSSHSTF